MYCSLQCGDVLPYAFTKGKHMMSSTAPICLYQDSPVLPLTLVGNTHTEGLLFKNS